jgi:hypothetical protein
MWIVRLALRRPYAFVVAALWPFSQFRTLVLSYPMIFARSFWRSLNSSRLLGIASPMVVTFFGYALSLGFFLFRRTRQKSNAASGTHCRREHELAQKKLTVVFSRLSAVPAKIKFDNYSWSC